MPSGLGGVVSTSAAPSGPAVRARAGAVVEPVRPHGPLDGGRWGGQPPSAASPVGTPPSRERARTLVVDVLSPPQAAQGSPQGPAPRPAAAGRRQRGNVALHEAAQDGGGEPRPCGEVVGFTDPPHLPPRGVDVGLLVAPHDLGAETRGDAVRAAAGRARPTSGSSVGGSVPAPSAAHSPYSGGGNSGVSRRPTTSASPCSLVRVLRQWRGRWARRGAALRRWPSPPPRQLANVLMGGGGEDPPPAETVAGACSGP